MSASAPGTRVSVTPSAAKFYAFRLKPGEDLLEGIRAVVNSLGLKAVSLVSCVGSLTKAQLRFAHTGVFVERTGHFEIVSLVGTVDAKGEHLHISLSDSVGTTIGAHFGPGSSVYTTAEVVIAELDGLSFRREPCPLSGYEELIVEKRAGA